MWRYLIGYLWCVVVLFGAQKEAVIDIEGMTCPLCTMTIKKNLKKQPGIIKASVKLSSHRATVRFNDAKIGEKGMLKAIEEVGYKGKILKIRVFP